MSSGSRFCASGSWASVAKVKRHPVLGFLFRSVVRGKELGVAGLEGVEFRFSKNRIRLRSCRSHPTVRVNNQPLVRQATVGDRTWIGTGGKLYAFMLSPLPGVAGASAD